MPAGKGEFAPHSKSMPLGKLAPHVAQLSGFGMVILTQPGLDFATAKFTPLPFESADQLVRVFDEGTASVRAALQGMQDERWDDPGSCRLADALSSRGRAFSPIGKCSSTTSSITAPSLVSISG